MHDCMCGHLKIQFQRWCDKMAHYMHIPTHIDININGRMLLFEDAHSPSMPQVDIIHVLLINYHHFHLDD